MKKNALSPDDERRIENQLKFLDLELTYGAKHYMSPDADPEIISEWLDHVKKEEEKYAKAPKVPVHTFIGKPKIKPLSGLMAVEVEPEIRRLVKKLADHCVLIDRPPHLNSADYYRFLTEDFMPHLMTNHAAPGMMHYFHYSEFHHDGPEFIEQHVSEFLHNLMDLKADFQGPWLSETCRDLCSTLTREEAMERCQIFRARYRKLEIVRFVPHVANCYNHAMYLLFHIEWKGWPVGNGKVQCHEGLGVSQLDWIDDEWKVEGVQMPGFEF